MLKKLFNKRVVVGNVVFLIFVILIQPQLLTLFADLEVAKPWLAIALALIVVMGVLGAKYGLQFADLQLVRSSKQYLAKFEMLRFLHPVAISYIATLAFFLSGFEQDWLLAVWVSTIFFSDLIIIELYGRGQGAKPMLAWRRYVADGMIVIHLLTLHTLLLGSLYRNDLVVASFGELVLMIIVFAVIWAMFILPLRLPFLLEAVIAETKSRSPYWIALKNSFWLIGFGLLPVIWRWGWQLLS